MDHLLVDNIGAVPKLIDQTKINLDIKLQGWSGTVAILGTAVVVAGTIIVVVKDKKSKSTKKLANCALA